MNLLVPQTCDSIEQSQSRCTREAIDGVLNIVSSLTSLKLDISATQRISHGHFLSSFAGVSLQRHDELTDPGFKDFSSRALHSNLSANCLTKWAFFACFITLKRAINGDYIVTDRV